MRSVAILGAGEIGAASARALAEREVVRHVYLVDAAGSVAAGKALDITQSGPIDGWDTRVTGGADMGSCPGPDALVVADRHGAEGEWLGEAGLELLRRLATSCACPVVFAGPRQHELMRLGARELRLGVPRLAGSAPEALASAARALTALVAGVSPADVDVSLVGTPGRFAIAWNASRVGGSPAEIVLSPPTLARLDRQVLASWPPGPYALGSAAAAVVTAMLTGSPRRRTAFCILTGPGIPRDAVAAAPVSLGPSGVTAVHLPELSPRERLVFETSLSNF